MNASVIPLERGGRPLVSVECDDRDLVAGLRRGEKWAAELLFDRYAPAITRMLRRTLGHERHEELVDLIHEVFVQAIGSIDKLRDADALLGWLLRIAAHTAYHTMRRRRARSWLRFDDASELPEVPEQPAPPEIQQAFRRLYELLEKFPADERLVFCLRYIEGLELTQVADTCDISLSTAKRRIAKAQRRFVSLAGQDAVLREWLKEGATWND